MRKDPPRRDEERPTNKRRGKTHQEETRKDPPLRDEERPTKQRRGKTHQ
jgi:hypothetical protein